MLMKLSELKLKLKKDKQHPKCYNPNFILHLPKGRLIDFEKFCNKNDDDLEEAMRNDYIIL